jgi:hypothetical protein
MEIQFDLMYHLGMNLTEIENCDLKELDWFHSRLVKQKKDEKPKKDGGRD